MYGKIGRSLGHGSGHLGHVRAAARTGGKIDSAETVFGVLIDHDFAGIDIGPQIVAGDLIFALNPQHVFGRQLLGPVKPVRHCALRDAEKSREQFLRSGAMNRLFQGFVSGWFGFHIPTGISKLIACQ